MSRRRRDCRTVAGASRAALGRVASAAVTVATVSSRTSERRQVTGCSRPGAAGDFVDREVSVGPVRDDVLAGREVLHDAIDYDRDLVRLERDQVRDPLDLAV